MPPARLLPKALRWEEHFHWRGGDLSRLEALADAVFALALTLLVVSLNVPRTFDEMTSAFAQVPAFAVCFFMLVMVWYYHYQYHRRYGLEDFFTVVVNAVLLFVVLLYVYPLRFLFTLLVQLFFGIGGTGAGSLDEVIAPEQWSTLMLVYSAGYTSIFVLFGLLYWHAHRRRQDLALNTMEQLVTLQSLRGHLASASVGVLSMAIVALAPRLFPLSGMIYAILGPLHSVLGRLDARERLRVRGPTPPDSRSASES